MCDVKKIADDAQVIVNGYAFTKEGKYIKVLNLNKPNKSVMMTKTGEVVETSMDDIELDIVQEYYNRNKKYMEE